MTSPSSSSSHERHITELRVSLTVIKSHAQLLNRRAWNLSEDDRDQLASRLQTIDAHVNRAAERLTLLSDEIEASDRSLKSSTDELA